MKLRQLLVCARAYVEPNVERAMDTTVDAWVGPYQGLPVPVRFRASGALRAWKTVLDTLPGLAKARQALSDHRQSPNRARVELLRALAPHIQASDDLADHVRLLITGTIHIASDMLCFWLRQGALYEPTASLGSLLAGVDVAADLPMAFIQPPTHTLTILPAAEHRPLCGGAQAITIYHHETSPAQAPVQRCLTIRCNKVSPDEGATLDTLTIVVDDEQTPLAQALEKALRLPVSPETLLSLDEKRLEEWSDRWRGILEYMVKVLLYLQVQDAQVEWCTPYTHAPRTFPGLGRKKREAKLTEVEKLYDRYVVGPVTLAGWAGEHAAQLGAGGQLSPHWRRGHFRQQAHGPAQSLRKIMFIKPTLVRSDRLTEVQS